METKIEVSAEEAQEVIKKYVLDKLNISALGHDVSTKDLYGTFTVDIKEKEEEDE